MSSRPDADAANEACMAATGAPPERALPASSAPPVPVSPEHAELQRLGAKAAARGEVAASNPMLDSINRPGATGETEQVWSERRAAWERGHGSLQSPLLQPTPAAAGHAVNEGVLDEALFGVTRVLTFSGDRPLTAASGFLFERADRLFLVTSRHVFFDAATQHAPDRIEIELHTDARDLTRMATLSILLHLDGVAVWRQARDSGGEIDVAVLELELGAMPADAVVRAFGPQHLAAGFDLFGLGDRLAIPAFPLGFFDTVHHLPVVRQASIASCYGVRFQGLGYFLTDGRMHRGCSGAPVLALTEPVTAERPRWCLLGVHSSRLDMATRDAAVDESLGLNCAWYADVLMALTGEAP